MVSAFVRDHAPDLDTEIVFIRQNQPGKRMAIGLVMRAIIRSGPDPDDLVVFMDGDSILGPGTLARCSVFTLRSSSGSKAIGSA